MTYEERTKKAFTGLLDLMHDDPTKNFVCLSRKDFMTVTGLSRISSSLVAGVGLFLQEEAGLNLIDDDQDFWLVRLPEANKEEYRYVPDV